MNSVAMRAHSTQGVSMRKNSRNTLCARIAKIPTAPVAATA